MNVVKYERKLLVINQQIKDMMRRDTYFRERMEELGYVDRPIVAVVDWDAQTIYATNGRFPFDKVDDDFLDLVNKTREGFNTKRTLMTETTVAYADELVENVPNIPHAPVQERGSREIFQNLFMYEMLLLNEIEQYAEMSEDQAIHLAGSKNLTQGVKHTSDELKSQYSQPQQTPPRDDFTLTL